MVKKKPLIYILHGWSPRQSTLKMWKPFLKLLDDAGYQSKYLKIPGLSQELNETWDMSNYLDWLEVKLNDKKDLILLGHSFGARLWINFCSRNSNNVKKLILIDAGGIRDQSIKSQIKRKTFWLAAKIGKKIFKGDFFRKLLYKLARERDYLEASPGLRKTLSNVLSKDVTPLLDKVKCKTLIIWGKNDRVTPISNAYTMNKLIKNSQLKLIEEGRHSPQFTHPEKVFKLVDKFLT